jgi:hypothetical protein
VAVAAGHSVDVDRWVREYDELMGRIAPRFARVETRRRARRFVLGLLAGLPRTNLDSREPALAQSSGGGEGVETPRDQRCRRP